MHEMHILHDLMDDLLTHIVKAKARNVTQVNLRMGEYSEINPEILRFFFLEHSQGTPLEGAKIHIEPSSTRELRLISFDCE